VQLVITVFDGGDKQIGQSKSSPSSTNEANFFNNSGFLDTSATRATDFYMSKNKDISSVQYKNNDRDRHNCVAVRYNKISNAGIRITE
jgi:hypothetical protein